MAPYIVGGIAVLLIVVGIVSTVRRIRTRSSCCSGGTYRPRKKRLKQIVCQKTFRVEGMHCERCSARVEEVVGDLPGLAGEVDLKKGLLTVSYAVDVEDEVILSRLARAGYPAIKL